MTEQFINDVMYELNNNVPDKYLETVRDVLEMKLSEYTIDRRETLPATIYNGEEIKHFFIAKKVDGCKMRSLNSYRQILSMFFATIQKAPKDVTTYDIRAFLYDCKERRHLKDNTIKGYRAVINSFFSWCRINKYLNENPCETIKAIKAHDTEEQPFDIIEMDMLREACSNVCEVAKFETLYSTGCRVAEFCSIKLDDVDFNNRSILIRHGKGDKQRHVFFSKRAKRALKMYLETRGGDSEYLFCNCKRPYNQLSIRSIERFLAKIADKSGVEGAHPHRLRKTFATDLLNHGVPLEVVRKLLGHVNISTTLIYAQVNLQELKYMHEKFIE